MTIPVQSGQVFPDRPIPDDQHPALLYLARLGQGSRRTMTEALEKIARIVSNERCDMRSLNWSDLRIEHTSALREELARGLAPATANKHLAALRGVLKEASHLGTMSQEDRRRATDLPSVRGTSPRKARILSPDELRSLVSACERDGSPAGARDAALFSLLIDAGLRRAEVAALDLADFDRKTGSINVRGNGTRAPWSFNLSRSSVLALEDMLGRRGVAAGPLFNPVNKGGRVEIRRLSEQAIYVACHKRAGQAGLPPVSPEDLRRSRSATRSKSSMARAGLPSHQPAATG